MQQRSPFYSATKQKYTYLLIYNMALDAVKRKVKQALHTKTVKKFGHIFRIVSFQERQNVTIISYISAQLTQS